MAIFKVRAFIPKWARNYVDFAVVIKVSDVGTFRPEFIRERKLFESVNNIFGLNLAEKQKCGQRDREKSFHWLMLNHYCTPRQGLETCPPGLTDFRFPIVYSL